jgi:hypothetical protein
MALSLFLGNVLLIAIACANPMYSQAILQRTLTQDMNKYLIEYNRYPGAISLKSNYYSYIDETDDKLNKVESIYEEMLQKMAVPTSAEVVYNMNTSTAESKMQDLKKRIQLASYSNIEEHIEITREVIAELDAEDKPVVYVYNKCDASGREAGELSEDSVAVSALTGEGVDSLLTMIDRIVAMSKRSVVLMIPYDQQFRINELYSGYTVESVDYLDEYVEVKAKLDAKGLGIYEKYIKA